MQNAEAGRLVFDENRLLVRSVVENPINVYTGRYPVTLVLGHMEGAELWLVIYRDSAKAGTVGKRPRELTLSFQHGPFSTLSETLATEWERERNPWLVDTLFAGYVEVLFARDIPITSDSYRTLHHYARCEAMLAQRWNTYPPRLYYRFEAFANEQYESWKTLAEKFK